MTENVLTVGTRASALALAQSNWAASRVAEAAGGRFALVRITTEGDRNQGPLATIGGTGVFVTAVRTALLDGRCDVIVHSCKDLPTAPAEGITIAAVPTRGDTADVLCARDGRTLADLPRGARVGTGSPRRTAQLLTLRPDLEVVPIRGNVDTRLGMVTDGRMDAVVLARAGLARLNRLGAVTQVFSTAEMLPAPGQGALVVECRTVDRDNSWYATGCDAVDDPAARAAVTAERSLLATLEAGCTAPLGAQGTVHGDRLTLEGLAISPDGARRLAGRRTGSVSEAAELGADLARELLARGAAELLAAP